MKSYTHISQTDYDTVAGPDWPVFSQFQQHLNVPEFVYAELDSMIRPPEGFSHPTFCVLPFYAMEYPTLTPCCLMSPEESLPEVQQKMLTKQRPASCKKCWQIEDMGLKSDRQLKNETLDYFADIDLEYLIEQSRQGKNKIVHYKIDTSNTCNAACVSCNGFSSSTWNRLLKKNNLVSFQNWKFQPSQTSNWIDYKNAVSVSFRGGESFLSDTNFYILEQLIAHKNTDCFVSFVTNGSFNLTKKQKMILEQFKNLNFCFSIDGIGSVFEYIRWPLKWQKIEDNISWCKKTSIDVSANFTLSNLNLLYLPSTLQWFEENNLKYFINPIESPKCLRPQSLSAGIKQKLMNHECHKQYAPWLGHEDSDEQLFADFQIEIAKQDKMKNISIQNYLPELVYLLDW
jgi:hypothetical protein